MIHNECRFLQLENTWNSGESSQEWLACHSSRKSQKIPEEHPRNCRPL
uniref:Uncharacterized protein n=1 Tax=Anguilla anguilla TaxID=7936 RepID=A0A0E9PN44_ANGAN